MYGFCDVPGCASETYMGWRPLSERLGRKVCERHWRRHNNPMDDFDLFEAFGFRRPAGIRKTPAKVVSEKAAARCDCARAVSLHQQAADALGCRQCGRPPETGHTFCGTCGQEQKRTANQERQKRYRAKHAQAVWV
ncbi:MAG: hypothetical protein JSW66_14700 [Phycisphaerales bacterium]|nr:MAG: hypothetical protein JSW66_14700 [Phycisphaerales bacterium]